MLGETLSHFIINIGNKLTIKVVEDCAARHAGTLLNTNWELFQHSAERIDDYHRDHEHADSHARVIKHATKHSF